MDAPVEATPASPAHPFTGPSSVPEEADPGAFDLNVLGLMWMDDPPPGPGEPPGAPPLPGRPRTYLGMIRVWDLARLPLHPEHPYLSCTMDKLGDPTPLLDAIRTTLRETPHLMPAFHGGVALAARRGRAPEPPPAKGTVSTLHLEEAGLVDGRHTRLAVREVLAAGGSPAEALAHAWLSCRVLVCPDPGSIAEFALACHNHNHTLDGRRRMGE